MSASAPDDTDPAVNSSPQAIADRLRAVVALRGGAKAAAARAGVSVRTISRAESGQPVKRGTLTGIAIALDISPSRLISGVGAAPGALASTVEPASRTALENRWEQSVGGPEGAFAHEELRNAIRRLEALRNRPISAMQRVRLAQELFDRILAELFKESPQ
ncbi:MAG: hypothetical protein ACP5NP_16010 [Acetobacteraceae bacterium]